ncbi:hypothetical protein BD779DRAFT_1587948 [Infundibulicybe gibba]|nr:hypothetical protein BD779DRAFT_1587948 [Infundibulicybe gibba]
MPSRSPRPSTPPPPHITVTRQRYKQCQGDLSAWMLSYAGQLGINYLDLVKKKGLKDTANTPALSTRGWPILAARIVEHGDSVIPPEFIQKAEECIELREEVSPFYVALPGYKRSNKRHAHVLCCLRKARNILESRKGNDEQSVECPSLSLDVRSLGTENGNWTRPSTPGTQAGADEPLDDIVPGPSQSSSEPLSHYPLDGSDLSSSGDDNDSDDDNNDDKNNGNGNDGDDYDDEIDMAQLSTQSSFCTLRYLQRCVRRAWTDYGAGKLPLITTSITTQLSKHILAGVSRNSVRDFTQIVIALNWGLFAIGM